MNIPTKESIFGKKSTPFVSRLGAFPPLLGRLARDLRPALRRHAFRPRLAALSAKRFRSWIFAVVRDSFFNLARQNFMT